MEVFGEARDRAFLETANEIASLWWLWIVKGILAVIFGALAWVYPDLTLVALIWILGAYFVADGVLNIIGMFTRDELGWGRRILLAIWGVVQILAGIVLWGAPGVGALTLMVIFGIWLMMTGVFLVVSAFTSDGYLMSPWLQGLFGVLGAIAGIYLVIEPGAGAVASVWVLGVVMVAHGIFQIIGGFQLRGKHQELDDRLKSMPAS